MTGARVLTALLLIPVVVGIVWFAPTAVVALGVAFVTLLTLREFFDLAEKAGFPGHFRWTVMCSLGFVYGQWSAGTFQTDAIAAGGWMALAPFLGQVELIGFLFVLGIALLALADKRGVAAALPKAATSAAGLLLIGLPLSYLLRLHGAARDGPRIVLFLLAVVWAGDTAAYFVGRAMGRHKLAPTISPNKTWEGAVANVIASLAVALAFRWWLTIKPQAEGLETSSAVLIGAAVVASLAGQVGDLLESAIKRGASVKDSGNLLPGHGGMWDRIDALILAAPAFWWYFQVMSLWR